MTTKLPVTLTGVNDEPTKKMEQPQAPTIFGCRKEVLLSETGGDRATAYTMSNKVLRVRDKYWTNSLATGPDGRLHLFFQVPFKPSPKTRYYGAGYLVSADGGRSWRQVEDGAPIRPPLEVLAAHRIEGKDINDAHVVEEIVHANFRLSHYYHGIHLSNTAVDGTGRPWVVFHRVQKEATLYHLEDGDWVGRELPPIVRSVLPKWRIHTQSSLVVRADGAAHLALVVAPEDQPGWGPSEAEILRLQLTSNGRVHRIGLVDRPDPRRARWLPSLEHRVVNAGSNESALLFTDGINAGGASANRNDVSTKVRMQLR